MAEQEANGTANWTIMVYMAAQNQLANFAIESLKQLKSAAGNDVVVAAQLHDDIDREIRRYIFRKTAGPAASEPETMKLGKGIPVKDDVDMASPETLTKFLDWASKECEADHYCLVLWSEGPFLEDAHYVDAPANADPKIKDIRLSRLMTVALKDAIKASEVGKRGELDIIVMDACCVSMIEVACELQECANFMIASQEEVSDLSFPYRDILKHIRDMKENSAEICAAVTGGYIAAYKDYVCNKHTSMREVTLSGLRLDKTNTVTDPLKKLSEALLSSVGDKDLRQAIIAARVKTKGFGAGLCVDLHDFCENLKAELPLRAIGKENLVEACNEVCGAISARSEAAFIIANQAVDSRCHGISIYFPYVTNEDEEELKNASGQRAKGGLDVPLKLSPDRIESIEKYYRTLQRFSEKTRWNEFIAHGWSLILAKEAPQELDRRYSGQQCAVNLLSLCPQVPRNPPDGRGNPGPPTNGTGTEHPVQRQPEKAELVAG